MDLSERVESLVTAPKDGRYLPVKVLKDDEI